MILDTLDGLGRYAVLAPRFAEAIAFLRQLGPAPMLGRHDIDGDFTYALVQQYQTRPFAGSHLEAHRRYVDIQYIVRGSETIFWAPVTKLAIATPYDATKDVGFFSSCTDVIPVPVQAGQCAILFPEDAHAPCCAWGEPAEVVKVVVKVAAESRP